MCIKNEKVQNRTYSAPKIMRIKLDNEISLVLQSTDAPGDPESLLSPEFFNIDPFKNNIA